MSSATFRKAINWLGILMISHIIAMIFFNLFLSGSVADLSVDDPLRASETVFAFDFVFDIIFAFMYFKIKTSYVDYQKNFIELLKSDDYSFFKYFKEYILKEQKIMTVVFILLQIPFVIFYAIWGMSLLYPILLEQIYIMDAGAYLLTHSALAGCLINTFIFTLVFLFVAANILKYRKKNGLRQEELANKLGVTSQAVSKWENAKAAPDITFLPIMADIFGCYIDDLFSREVKTEIHYDHCAEFPWPDDNTIRIFQTMGKKIIKSQEDKTCIEVAFPQNCNETTRQYFKVEVFGNIVSDGSINGDVVCHGRIDCNEINGDVNTQGDISAYAINCSGKIICNEIKKGE